MVEDRESSFFISYAHADAAYVARLADHLRRSTLPLWFDAELRWGSRFTQEIRRRVAHALGVIVVMSPAAAASEWVEREILEGQRHDRELLPILLGGERLFLLASSHWFDARDGALPGERELRQLRGLRDDSHGSLRAAEATETHPTPAPTTAPAAHVPVDLAVEKVRAYLAEGRIDHADILTTSLLLEAVGRLDSGWMRRSDGRDLPFDLLRSIDDAWSGSSRGVHGFGAQLSLHRRHPEGAPAGRQRDFSALARALGWTGGRHDSTPRYGAFVGRADHRAGFFPTLRNPQLERHQSWYDQWMETAMAVHLQLRRWRWGGQG